MREVLATPYAQGSHVGASGQRSWCREDSRTSRGERRSWPAGAPGGLQGLPCHRRRSQAFCGPVLSHTPVSGGGSSPRSQGCGPRMRDKASMGMPAAGRSPLPPHDLSGLGALSGVQLTRRAGLSLLLSPSWGNSEAVSVPAEAPDGFPDPRHTPWTASLFSSSFPGSPGSWDLIPPSRPVPGPTAARRPPSVPGGERSPLGTSHKDNVFPGASGQTLCTWGCSGRGKGV